MRLQIIDDGSDFDRQMDALEEERQAREESAIAEALTKELESAAARGEVRI